MWTYIIDVFRVLQALYTATSYGTNAAITVYARAVFVTQESHPHLQQISHCQIWKLYTAIQVISKKVSHL